MCLSDDSFLHQFECQTLPIEEFGHLGHLRLAWLYLNRCDLETAIEKTTRGISAYATSQGATDKFHHTLTEAIVRLMFARMQACEGRTLDEYLEAHQDLVDNINSVVLTHYSKEVLFSPAAKAHFIKPDLMSLT